MIRSAWLSEIALLAGLVLLGLFLGSLVGATGWWLMVAFAVVLARHLWQLARLEKWLGSGRQRNPPESWGLWGEVFEHYFRLQKRYYKRKKRLARVIREFRESTAAMPDGSLVLDGDFRILWFNLAAEEMLRLSNSRDLGQSLVNLVRSPRLAAYLSAGEFDEPIILRSPADESRSLSARLIPYGSNQYLALFRDVTRMQRLQAMRRDFVANASHELRSPLTVLSGYLEGLVEDPALNTEWREPVAEMQRQCRRMSVLVSDLIELSRLETEEPDPARMQRVDIAALIQRIVREAELQKGEAHQLQVTELADCRLIGIESELHSAFGNLVINAIRYTGDQARIEISWRREADGRAAFEVRDNGIGIEARHLPFITQRFYRIDSARGRSRDGTGLGLAIVKHVLQRHGGRLEVSSAPGQGSTFRCVFAADRVVSGAAAGVPAGS